MRYINAVGDDLRCVQSKWGDMDLQALTHLEVAFGQGVYRQTLAWPIVERTDKAWKIDTSGGALWVPIWRWQGQGPCSDQVRLQSLLALFANISSTHPDARILVKRLGKGSSDKSVRVGFFFCKPDTYRPGWGTEKFDRSATLALSLLSQDASGNWSAPVWAIHKKLDAKCEKLAGDAFWPGLPLVQVQLQDAFDAAEKNRQDQEQEQRAAAQARQRIEDERQAERARAQAAASAQRLILIAEEGELALAFARRRLTLADLGELGYPLAGWPKWLPGDPVDRPLENNLAALVEAVRQHPEFSPWRQKNAHLRGALLKPAKAVRPSAPRKPDRVIENATVHWTDWTGRSMQRDERCESGCRVLVFGKKHEITLMDGSVLTKMAGPNLKIFEQPNPCGGDSSDEQNL